MTFWRSLTAASISLTLLGVLGLGDVHYDRAQAEGNSRTQAVILVDNKSLAISTDALRVSGLLRQAGISLNPGDVVAPEQTSPVSNGMTVRVIRATTEDVITECSIPPHTTILKTLHLLPGHRQVWIPGKPGVEREYVRIASVNGHETYRSVLNSRILHKPTDRVILIGVDPFMASRSFSRYRRIVTMVATKYDVYLGGAGTGITRTGIRARRGIVAVDPRFIRLGTRLYVEGYGYAIAADTGGAIKGRRIDLCVESPGEADRYGRHHVRVLILKK